MRLAPLVIVLALAGCGGSAHPGPSLVGASARTIAAVTARFTLTVAGTIGGVNVGAMENGTLAFTRRRAHIYKLLPGGGIPQEEVIIGPFTYANGNVEAAMNDSTIKAWTKLDTRKLSAKQRRSNADELAHVRAAALLAYGVTDAKRLGSGPNHTTHFSGTVDPALLARHLPAGLRASIAATVKNDYAAGPFKAEFWVDAAGRITRVHVAYDTGGTGHIVVDAAYSDFGTPVDLTIPPADGIQDISP